MNIVVFLPNWIGDVVMATPALRALSQAYPFSRRIAVARPYVNNVLSGSPWIDEFVSSSDPWWRVAARLHSIRGEVTIVMPNSFRSAWIAWLSRCKRRIGFARDGRSALLNIKLQSKREPNGRFTPAPILLAYNELAVAAGCASVGRNMELFTTAHDEELADRIWSTTGLDTLRTVYCLNPGAAYGSAKLWPAEHFAALARRLADDSSAGVMVLCGPSERALATQIVALADCERVHSLADAQVSIGLTKACIRRSSLVVSTDSGPRHIAAAFQRPVVALFGPTHQAWTDTFYDREIRLQRQVECGPCQLRHCPLDHRCMKELRVDEVLAAVQMLERTDTFSQRSGDYCAA